MKEIYEIGETPPLGNVPPKMHAQLIRQDRFGEPTKAFKVEEVDVPPTSRPDEVLVYVMAAGINYNNVWAAPRHAGRRHQGAPEGPADPTGTASTSAAATRPGIVYKVGSDVTNVKVGDEVVIHCGMWNRDDPVREAPATTRCSAPSFRIWGYETNWGSFAQFTRVQAHQCLPKPKHLTWEAAAAYMLVGATAYRMLHGWPPHTCSADDVVLDLGRRRAASAARRSRSQGGWAASRSRSSPATTRSSSARRSARKRRASTARASSTGACCRTGRTTRRTASGLKGARAFGAALWEAVGERKSPRIVFEHPGEDTVPTSIFVCDTGGMVVICAGTTGYNATSTCATSGCARSASRARTSPTTSRRRG